MLEKFESINTAELTFGRELNKARNRTGETRVQMALKCGVPKEVLGRWESGTLPPEEALPVLAQAYGILLPDLEKAYNTSREVKQRLKEGLKSARKKGKGKGEEELFPGHIENSKTIRRVNQETPKRQFGRE